MSRILIADTQEIFRIGVKQIIKQMPGKFVVDEAAHCQEVIEKVWAGKYHAVLLDISISGKNGLDLLKQLKSYKADIQVLIVSIYPEQQFALRALKAGAAGYLTKACSQAELVAALQKVLTGKKHISSSLADILAFYIENEEIKAPHEALSAREYEVMCMTAEGKPVKQIAMELSLSDKTISTYRSRIMEKLHINNIAQLIQYAIQNRILDQHH